MKLIAVTNRHICAGDFCERIAEIAARKPETVILREKDLSEPEYAALLSRVKAVCEPYGVPLTAHSFHGAARSQGLDRLHLPFSLFEKTGRVPAGFQAVGVSVHSREEALRAAGGGASYLIAGHIFNTDCKSGLKPRGLSFLSEIVAASGSIPVYAIGGISRKNAQAVSDCGAAGICLMSSLMRGDR